MCRLCHQTFNPTYFKRHLEVCPKNSETVHGQTQQPVTSNENEVEGKSSDDDDDDVDISYADFREEMNRILGSASRHPSEQAAKKVFREMSAASDEESPVTDDELNYDVHEDDNDMDSIETDDEENAGAGPWVISLCLFLATLQTLFGVTDGVILFCLKFLALYMGNLGNHLGNDFLKRMCCRMPGTMYKFWNILGYENQESENFSTYVICKKCFQLYKYEDSWTIVEGTKISKRCSFKEFPSHPVAAYRRPCGEELLHQVEHPGGKKVLEGKYLYCYKSLRKSLQEFVLRPGYEKLCEKWQDRDFSSDIMTDVYDGRVWKEFLETGYLTEPRNYGLMLNLDWFQPFDLVQYSVGAIYMVNLNLPRTVRFKRQNIFLCGLMPDMDHEPPTNTFLRPLVDELLEGWTSGFEMKSHESPDQPVRFKVALMCVGCDIPATRKLCGFLGHAATVGCSRCLKQFPGAFGCKNYGGFDTENWIPRTNAQHRRVVREIQSANTKTEKEAKERLHGARYSVLLDLPYYSAVTMAIIDPMHNLFLGTAKHMLRVWRDLDLLPADSSEIQKVVDSFCVPSDLGRIPKKIESKFSSLTADQLKNWILYFSIVALKPVLPQEHLDCWRNFVLACQILCKRSIFVSEVKRAHHLLVRFCRKFEELYGAERVTPNMHLHAHLCECIEAYGPVYTFWLFSFERYNGLLGRIPTNRKGVEKQMFRRFMKNLHVMRGSDSVALADMSHMQFLHAECAASAGATNQVGSVNATMEPTDVSDYLDLLRMSAHDFPIVGSDWSKFRELITCYSSKNYVLNDNEFRCLCLLYRAMYETDDIEICPNGQKFSHFKVGNELFGSRNSRTRRSSIIGAFWPNRNGDMSDEFDIMDCEWPGQVQFYLKHSIFRGEFALTHVLACVEWYNPVNNRNPYGKPVGIWQHSIPLPSNSASFIPVQRIRCKYIQAPVKVERRNLVAVVARNRFS